MMYLITGILFFAVSIYLYSQYKHELFEHVMYVILSLGSVLLQILFVVGDYMTGKGISNALIYHVRHDFTGAAYKIYVPQIIAGGVLVLLAVCFIVYAVYSSTVSVKKHRRNTVYAFLLIILVYFANPGFFQVVKIYAEAREESKELEIATQDIKKIGDQKNLVFIYLESFEDTYSNDFENLTPRLNALAEKGLSFKNIGQLDLDWFTVGGMVASQCGTSLRNWLYSEDVMDKKDAKFCLGDFLHTEGYHLSYMAGAKVTFANKSDFYKNHKFDSIKGFDELKEKLPDEKYHSEWGLYDDSLLPMVYDEFVELSKSKQPFALFTLTLDTHAPHGYPSKTCTKYTYPYIKSRTIQAIHCSDALVADLVEKILSGPYAKDTVIVVASDHLAMQGDSSRFLEGKDRKNRLLIINPQGLTGTHNTKGSTRDTGTTLLRFLGYKGSIGLGKDLLEP